MMLSNKVIKESVKEKSRNVENCKETLLSVALPFLSLFSECVLFIDFKAS